MQAERSTTPTPRQAASTSRLRHFHLASLCLVCLAIVPAIALVAHQRRDREWGYLSILVSTVGTLLAYLPQCALAMVGVWLPLSKLRRRQPGAAGGATPAAGDCCEGSHCALVCTLCGLLYSILVLVVVAVAGVMDGVSNH